MLSPWPPVDPSRLTPTTPFRTRFGAGWSQQTVTRAESGAASDLGGKTGGGGTGQNPAGARGEGRARPPGSRKGEKRNQRMSPRAQRRAVSKRHLPPSGGAKRSRAGSGCDPPGTSSGTHSRHPCGSVCTGAQSIVRALVSRLVSPSRSGVSPGDTRSCAHSQISFEKNNIFLEPPPPSLQTGSEAGIRAGPDVNNGRWEGSGLAIGWREE